MKNTKISQFAGLIIASLFLLAGTIETMGQTVTVLAAPGAQGDVSTSNTVGGAVAGPGDIAIDTAGVAGEGVIITAIPALGFKFVNWTGDIPDALANINPALVSTTVSNLTLNIVGNFIEVEDDDDTLPDDVYPITKLVENSGYCPDPNFLFDFALERFGFDGIPGTADDPGTDPEVSDTDGDGLPDGWEYYFWWFRDGGTNDTSANVTINPLVPGQAGNDDDNDGLSNLNEYLNCTDPTHCDTDRDGMDDKWELDNGLNPLDPKDAGGNPDADAMAARTIEVKLLGGGTLTTSLFHNAVYLQGADTMEAGDTAFDPRTAWFSSPLTHPDTAEYTSLDEYLGCDRIPRIQCDPDGLVTNANASVDATNPLDADGDNDGVQDGWECYVGMNPNDPPGSQPDSLDDDDDDLLLNGREWGNYTASVENNSGLVWENKLWPTDPGVTDREPVWRNVWFDENTNGLFDAGEQVWDGQHDDGFTVLEGTLGRDTPLVPSIVFGFPEEGLFYKGASPAEGLWLDNSFGPNGPGEFDLGVDTVIIPGTLVDGDVGETVGLLWFHDDPHPMDTDYDGLPDATLPDQVGEDTINANPTSVDTDGDFLPDGWETYGGTDVLVKDASVDQRENETIDPDPDLDGLVNHREYWTGTVFEWMHLDPTWPDYMIPSGIPVLVSRTTMRWDGGGTGENTALRDQGSPLPFILPPDYASCPSFHVANGQRAATAKFAGHYHTTLATDSDSDADGMDDFWEVYHGLNPTKGRNDLVQGQGSRKDAGAAVGAWDMDPDTVGIFEMGVIKGPDTIIFTNVQDVIANFDSLTLFGHVGPFNFGLENMDQDADGIVNWEEYSYEASLGGRAVHHTDPTSYNRTDDRDPSSFVSLNYLNPNNEIFSWKWSDTKDLRRVPNIFVFENTEGFDTDNDIFGDLAEIAKIPSLGTVGNSDPVDSLDPIRNRAVRFEFGDFLRSQGGWVTGAPKNFFTRFTVESWVRPANIAGAPQASAVVVERAAEYVSMWGGLVRVNFRIGIDTATGVPFAEYNGAGAFDVTLVSAGPARALALDDWAHLAATYDGNMLTLYVNGEMVQSVPSTFLPANGVGTGFAYPGSTMVGASDVSTPGQHVFGLSAEKEFLDRLVGAQNFYDGWIDEVRIWNGAQPQNNILNNMREKQSRTATSTQSADGSTDEITLVHYFPFDDVPDPDVSWEGGSDEPVVPVNIEILQGVGLQMHQTIPSWFDAPQGSTVYSGSVTNPYNYIVYAEDVSVHASVEQPQDDFLHWVTSANGTDLTITEPEGYKNSSNPYASGNDRDLLFMRGAVADGDVFTNNTWMTGTPLFDPDGNDSDGDGLPDNWETENGLDPTSGTGDNGPDGDPDGDGLSNWYEYLTGNNPFATDTDGDGLRDGVGDFDDDGLNNLKEQDLGTFPHVVDTDDDGLSDGEEFTGLDAVVSGTTDPSAQVPVGPSDPLNSLDPLISRSIQLDGASRVIIPPQNKFMSTYWTLNMWVNPDTVADGVLVSRFLRDSVTGLEYTNYELGVQDFGDASTVMPYVRYTGEDGVEVFLSPTNGFNGTASCSGAISIDEWTHLTASYGTNGILRLYINGSEVAFSTDAIGHLPATRFGPGEEHFNDEVTLGASRSTTGITDGFSGFIDEFSFYSVELTPEEITEVVNSAPVAQPATTDPYTIRYKNGYVTPPPGVGADLSTVGTDQPVNMIVQFETNAEPTNLAALQGAGLSPKYRVSDRAYMVNGTRSQLDTLPGLRWSGLVPAAKKISSLVDAETSSSQLVEFFPGTSTAGASAAVAGSGAGDIGGGLVGGHFMIVNGTTSQLGTLASDNAVALITKTSDYILNGNFVPLNCSHSAENLGAAPFVTVGEGWDGPGQGGAALTYHFNSGTSDLPNEEEVIVSQMNAWGDVANITFTEAGSPNLDLQIEVDFLPIDGAGGILAFAYYPAPDPNPETVAGDQVYDSLETWVDGPEPDSSAGFDLNFVALHELGHSLGLGHSQDPDAVMFPFYQAGVDVALTQDDIDGILAIYGESLAGSGGADFRFDDGGETAEDFAASMDWMTEFKHAGVLDGAVFSTNTPPFKADSDEDGMPDRWERQFGLNPFSAADAITDSDLDGLNNLYEFLSGTNPSLVDSDLNGVDDSREDADGDELVNIEEQTLGSHPGRTDTDDDGIEDGDEINGSSDPLSGYSPENFRAMEFDGSGRLVVRTERDVEDHLDWTVEAWVKPDNTSVDGIVIRRAEKIPFGSDDALRWVNYELGLENNVPYILYRYRDGVTPVEERVEAPKAVDAEWTHLAAVMDTTDHQLRLFVNGKRVAYERPGICPPISACAAFETTIGGGHVDSGIVQEGFSGAIDNVRVWTYARTSLEVQSNRDVLQPEFSLDGIPDESRAPIRLFNFDDGGLFAQNDSYPGDWLMDWMHAAEASSGGVTEISAPFPPKSLDSDDDTHSDFHEVSTNSAVYRSESPFEFNALSFDGTGEVVVDELVDNEETLLYAFPAWTLETWVQPTVLPVGEAAVIRRELKETGQVSFELGLINNGGVLNPYARFNRADSGSEFAMVTSVEPIAVGASNWTHLAASFSNSVFSLYLNGELVAVDNFPGTDPVVDGPGTVYLGSTDYQGLMQETRIWNNVRTAEQIRENYRNILLFSSSQLAASFQGGDSYLGRVSPEEEGTLRYDYTTLQSFDGTFSYLSGLRTHAFAMSGWVKMNPDSTGGMITERLVEYVASGEGTDQRVSHGLYITEDGFPEVRWLGDLTVITPKTDTNNVVTSLEIALEVKQKNLSTEVDVRDGTWHHVAVSADSMNIQIYVDGNLEGDSRYNTFFARSAPSFESLFSTYAPTAESLLRVGGRLSQPGRWFDGVLDEVTSWNEALTEAQLLKLKDYGLDRSDIEAGLKPIDPIPEDAIPRQPEHRRLVSYLTFDGEFDLPFVPDNGNLSEDYRQLSKTDTNAFIRPSGPPIVVDRVRSLFENLKGYFAAYDGGEHVENYSFRNIYSYAGCFEGNVGFELFSLRESRHLDSDSDDDGIFDGWEDLVGLDPGDASDAESDLDGDDLTARTEYEAGTDPRDPDSDGNGYSDRGEDGDNDGLVNIDEQEKGSHAGLPDTDDDGLSDYQEDQLETSPIDSLIPAWNLALTLDGATNSYVYWEPRQPRFALENWAIEAFVMPTTTGEVSSILARSVEPGVFNYAMGLTTGGFVEVRFTPTDLTADIVLTSTQSVVVGSWTHVLGRYDTETDALQIEINGVVDSVWPIDSGKRPITAGIGPDYIRVGQGFAGEIDEVRIWSEYPGERTLEELSSSLSGSESNLVAYLRFDDGTHVTGTSGLLDLQRGQFEDFTHSTDWNALWDSAASRSGGATHAMRCDTNIFFESADCPLDGGLDILNSDWTTGAESNGVVLLDTNAYWYCTTVDSFSGESSLKSSYVVTNVVDGVTNFVFGLPDSSSNFVETAVLGPGELCFTYRTAIEPALGQTSGDQFNFSANGSELLSVTGDNDWTEVCYVLASGIQTLRWEMVKDADSGWYNEAIHVDAIKYDPGPDSDNDGLSDSQEPYYGTLVDNPDTDGDGILDGIEVKLGSDPLTPAEIVVSNISIMGGHAFVDWPAQAGVTYQVQKSEDAMVTWFNAANGGTQEETSFRYSGSIGTLTYKDPIPVGPPVSYRVIIVVP